MAPREHLVWASDGQRAWIALGSRRGFLFVCLFLLLWEVWNCSPWKLDAPAGAGAGGQPCLRDGSLGASVGLTLTGDSDSCLISQKRGLRPNLLGPCDVGGNVYAVPT